MITSQNRYGNVFKWFLHTRLGARVGFALGIRGYNHLSVVMTSPDGIMTTLPGGYNSRVNVGAALIASLSTGANQGGISSPHAPIYIALSTNTLTLADTDTTLSGETSATGLARTLGTVSAYTAPTNLDGEASYAVSNTFTNTSGSSVTIKSAALFDAASSGNMFTEANLPQNVVVANGAQIAILWTVNL